MSGYSVNEQGEVFGPKGARAACTGQNGYYKICVNHPEFGRKNISVHRLAAFQWFGETIFEAGKQIRHLDGNKTNNSKNNLEPGTSKQNHLDRPKSQRLNQGQKAAASLRKYPDQLVKELMIRRAGGASYKTLIDEYKIPKSTLSYILNHATYVSR